MVSSFLLAFYLVVKEMEVLQIALASNREKRGGIITFGVLVLIACLFAAGTFVTMQNKQAQSINQQVINR